MYQSTCAHTHTYTYRHNFCSSWTSIVDSDCTWIIKWSCFEFLLKSTIFIMFQNKPDSHFIIYRVDFICFWQLFYISDILISFSIEKLYVGGLFTLSRIRHPSPPLCKIIIFLWLVPWVSSFFSLPFMPLVLITWTFVKHSGTCRNALTRAPSASPFT